MLPITHTKLIRMLPPTPTKLIRKLPTTPTKLIKILPTTPTKRKLKKDALQLEAIATRKSASV